MNPWPKHPVIYEINTRVWLNELSRKYERPVTLAAVPSGEWDTLSSLGADAVWFMGVWERSPAGAAMVNQNKPAWPGVLQLNAFQPGLRQAVIETLAEIAEWLRFRPT